MAAGKNDTKILRNQVREHELQKAVLEEQLQANRTNASKIRHRALTQCQLVVDLQRAFKTVLAELAQERQLVGRLKQSQESANIEFKGLMEFQAQLLEAKMSEDEARQKMDAELTILRERNHLFEQ